MGLGFLIGCAIFVFGGLMCFNPGTKMTSDKKDARKLGNWLMSVGIWGPGDGDEQKEVEDFLDEFNEEDRATIERLSLGR